MKSTLNIEDHNHAEIGENPKFVISTTWPTMHEPHHSWIETMARDDSSRTLSLSPVRKNHQGFGGHTQTYGARWIRCSVPTSLHHQMSIHVHIHIYRRQYRQWQGSIHHVNLIRWVTVASSLVIQENHIYEKKHM